MRAWYVDRRNEPVLDVRMLVSFACALVLVLAWLLPREETFRQMLADGKADHVSIAYARLLSALNPDDAELRALLAGQYLQIGELERAWAIIGGSEESPGLLRITILERLLASGTDPETRSRWSTLLSGELALAAGVADLDDASAAGLTRAAYALERPDLVAAYFERRYRETGAEADLLLAVSAWQAADRAGSAAELLNSLNREQLAGLSDAGVSRALEIYLAASRFEQGFRFIEALTSSGGLSDARAVRFVEFAQLADAADRVAAYLGAVESPGTLADADLMVLAGAAIATSELTRAARYFEILLERRPADLDTREELARVYRWAGRPEAALSHWLDLVDRTGLEAYLVSAWRLAEGLYRYDLTSALLTDLAGSRRLSDEELEALRNAYELQGQPDRGIEVIGAYVRRHPDHRQAWLSLIGLEQANEYLAEASRTWSRFARHHEPDVKERLRWADLLWERYRTEEAVDLLLARESAENAEYWLRLATYGWFLDDMSLVSRAYSNLVGLEPLAEDHFERFLAAVFLTDPAEARQWARYGWEHYGQPAYLLQALQWAMTDGDYDMARTLLALPETQRALLAGSPEYWELAAYYHQQQGDPEAARSVLATGLTHHPQRVSLITPYLWLLIGTAERAELADALEQYASLAVEASELWPVYASGWARLNEHRSALAWFNKAVDVTPDDLGLLLAYAGSLQALGLEDPAYRVRRHVVGALIAGHSYRGLELRSLAEAARSILNPDQQRILALRLVEGSEGVFGADELPRLYLAQALAQAHYTAAGFWLERDADPDPWDRLAVAADRHDRDALNQLLEHRDPLIGINAALALDRPDMAYRAPGFDLLDEFERLDVATRYYDRFPTGWQTGPEYSRISGLEVNSLMLGGARRLGGLAVDGRITGYRLRDALRLVPGETEEWLASVGIGQSNRLGELRARITLLDSSGETLPGFTLSQSLELNRHHRLSLGAAYQQLTEITALARAVSQRSGLDFGWQSHLGRRNRWSLTASLDRYQDRFGDPLGDGTQLEARFDHAWKLAGPEILVGTSVYLTRNSERTPGDRLITELLLDRGERLLPERNGRVALNASVSRGTPGTLRWALPSPRYRLGAGVGYQWPESAPTLELEGSLGLRVLGNDELSFRAAYTSSLLSGVGGDGYRATLLYSKRLGR